MAGSRCGRADPTGCSGMVPGLQRSQSFHAALNKALTNSGNTLLLLAFRACRAANAGTLLTPLLTYSERSLLYLSQSEASRWPGLLPGPSCCGCVSKTDAAPASDDITADPEMSQAALCAAMTKPLHSGPPHPRRATRHGVGPEPQYLSGASRRLAVRNDGRRNCRRARATLSACLPEARSSQRHRAQPKCWVVAFYPEKHCSSRARPECAPILLKLANRHSSHMSALRRRWRMFYVFARDFQVLSFTSRTLTSEPTLDAARSNLRATAVCCLGSRITSVVARPHRNVRLYARRRRALRGVRRSQRLAPRRFYWQPKPPRGTLQPVDRMPTSE